jgi:hypothetical protein
VDNNEIYALFHPLWVPDHQAFERVRPLLAHYTSIEVVESVLTTNELWFSNPLLMNDLEEVQFSVEMALQLVSSSTEIQVACQSMERFANLSGAFRNCYTRLAHDHIYNTYVLCFSEHTADDEDGLLSMWRGYGGEGSGAAIVFDTGKLDAISPSPLILGKVSYGTQGEREAWIKAIITQFARLLQGANIPDDQLWLAAHALFARLKVFALFSKHKGFKEENEWRIAYDPDRDSDKRLASMFSYRTGPRGIEPKLKLPVTQIEGVTGPNLSLESLIDRILLGPSVASPMAVGAFNAMLDKLHKPALKSKVRRSRIPYRSPR